MGGLIGLGFSSLPPQASGARAFASSCSTTWARACASKPLTRIGEYLGQPLRFDSEQQAADYLWTISTGFGPHTPEQWLALSRPLLKPALMAGPGVALRPPISPRHFKSMTAESATSGEALWQVYEALTSDVLLLRGKNSDLLDAETAAMTERGPKARLVEFDGVGHAPPQPDHKSEPIRQFLLGMRS